MEVYSCTYTDCKNSTSVVAAFVQPAEHNFIACLIGVNLSGVQISIRYGL
jgi:hypothetical protein